MALSITFKGGFYKVWHVGERLDLAYEAVNNIVEIQADSTELDMIMSKFSNLPTVKYKQVVRYFGDTARFIVANM